MKRSAYKQLLLELLQTVGVVYPRPFYTDLNGLIQNVQSSHVNMTFERESHVDPLLRRSWSWRTV
jgi:hypothetical protein